MEHLRPQFGLCSETMTVMCRLGVTSKDSEDQFADVEAEAEGPTVDRRRGNEATGLTIRRPGIAGHHASDRSESKRS
jgi:hypothetical protein